MRIARALLIGSPIGMAGSAFLAHCMEERTLRGRSRQVSQSRIDKKLPLDIPQLLLFSEQSNLCGKDQLFLNGWRMQRWFRPLHCTVPHKPAIFLRRCPDSVLVVSRDSMWKHILHKRYSGSWSAGGLTKIYTCLKLSSGVECQEIAWSHGEKWSWSHGVILIFLFSRWLLEEW